MSLHPISVHGPQGPEVLSPDADNIYYVSHGPADFLLPRKSDCADWDQCVLKLFGSAHNRVSISEHPDDEGATRWIGSAGGDYINILYHANGNWYVFDHHETVILRLNKDNHQSVSGGQRRKVKSWHVVEDTAGLGYPDQLNVPLPARMDLSWGMVPGKSTNQSGIAAEVTVGGVDLEPNFSQLTSSNANGSSYTHLTLIGFFVHAGQVVELYARNLERDADTWVDARSEAWVRLRWRL